MIASEAQSITIQRGLIPAVDQKITMAPGSITMDGGTGTIMIESMTEITLSVGGGASMIRLTPSGIQIQACAIQITGQPFVIIKGLPVAIN